MLHYIDSQRLLRYVTITTSIFNGLKSFPFLRRIHYKLSNFNFQRTKTLYQNNFKRVASFFTFFEDEINSKEKVVMGRAQENKVRKL